MPDYLQIWGAQGADLVPLEGDRVSVGKASGNDIVVSGDDTVSRLHALLERYPAGWCVRDLCSSNGTFVNGDRVSGDRPVRNGDEIRVGSTRLTVRLDQAADPAATAVADEPPDVTRRERDVLVALCRPLVSGDVFTEAASVKDIASALFVSDAAVKQHIANLYDKFELYDDSDRKRGRLANEALRRRAVSLAELKAAGGP